MMTNKVNADQIISKLGYDHYGYVLPQNHWGGIWILWNDIIFAQVLFKEQRAVHLLVYNKVIKKESRLSGILAQQIDKDAFWNYLTNNNSIFWGCSTINKVMHMQNLLNVCMVKAFSFRMFVYLKKIIHGKLVYERLNKVIDRRDWLP